MEGVILDRKARDAEWSKLMRAAIAGDEAAYRRLLEDLSRALRNVVRRGFGGVGISRNDVEDVVQDVLLAIHLKRHTWDQSMPLAPWVIAVARNKMIDDLRRRHRRPEVSVDLSAVPLRRRGPATRDRRSRPSARSEEASRSQSRDCSLDEHRWAFRSRCCGKTRNDGDRGTCDVAPKP